MLDRSRPERQRVHTVVFDDPEAALNAVRGLRKRGFEIPDVHSPFPIHGMDEAMGLRETRLPWATFIGGLMGISLGLGFQIWTHAVDWPLNIGGKTNIAWQALVPISFEVTVLLAAFATVITLFIRGRLFVRVRPEAPMSQPHQGVTDDRFVVLVKESDGSFSPDRFHALCKQLGAQEVVEAWGVI